MSDILDDVKFLLMAARERIEDGEIDDDDAVIHLELGLLIRDIDILRADRAKRSKQFFLIPDTLEIH